MSGFDNSSTLCVCASVFNACEVYKAVVQGACICVLLYCCAIVSHRTLPRIVTVSQDASACADPNRCCVDAPTPLGPDCVGDHRGQWSFNDTQWFQGQVSQR